MGIILSFLLILYTTTVISKLIGSSGSQFGINSLQDVFNKYNSENIPVDRSLDFLIYPTSPAPVAKIGTEENAKNFMTYAGAAYCPPNSIINWNCANCKGYATDSTNSVYLSAPAADAAGYLTINNKNKQIIIAYRGTNDIFNWLYNIIILYFPAGLPYPYSGAQIHYGFYAMANALYAQSKIAVQNAINRHPDYQLVFVGHSLGGAIAEIVAFKLAQNNVINWENTSIYTYGQPRTGDLQFARYVNSKPWTFTRVTSYGDIIPNLPSTVLLGYAHNQHNMFINKNGKVDQCSITHEDPNCITPAWNTIIGAHKVYWGIDINTYCN